MMLSLGHALLYAYWEGSRWKNFVEDVCWTPVGISRLLEKVDEAASLMACGEDGGEGEEEPG